MVHQPAVDEDLGQVGGQVDELADLASEPSGNASPGLELGMPAPMVIAMGLVVQIAAPDTANPNKWPHAQNPRWGEACGWIGQHECAQINWP